MRGARALLGEFQDRGEFLVILSIAFTWRLCLFVGRRGDILFLLNELVDVFDGRCVLIMEVLNLRLECVEELLACHIGLGLQVESDETFNRRMQLTRWLIHHEGFGVPTIRPRVNCTGGLNLCLQPIIIL